MASKAQSTNIEPEAELRKRAKQVGAKDVVPWKPKDKNSACPYLIVPCVKTMIEFLEKSFDDVKTVMLMEKDGRVRHAEVKFNNDSIVMMGDAQPGWEAVKCNVHVYVPDVDSTFEKAVKAGGKVVDKPSKQGDPCKRGAIADPSETITWWIGTQVELPEFARPGGKSASDKGNKQEANKEVKVVPWKPEDKVSASPYLIVPSAKDLIAFIEKVFDAEALCVMEEGGSVVHAEVKINNDSIFMMSDAHPGRSEAKPCHVHIYVPDVDATFQKAVEAGGKEVEKPVKREDPDKRGGIQEPSGIVTFWIGTQVDLPPIS